MNTSNCRQVWRCRDEIRYFRKSHGSRTFTSQRRLHRCCLHKQMNKGKNIQKNELPLSLEKKILLSKVAAEEEVGRGNRNRTQKARASPPLSLPQFSLLPPRQNQRQKRAMHSAQCTVPMAINGMWRLVPFSSV